MQVQNSLQFRLGAFFVALGVACYTHYHKIVQNEYFGYPDVRLQTFVGRGGY